MISRTPDENQRPQCPLCRLLRVILTAIVRNPEIAQIASVRTSTQFDNLSHDCLCIREINSPTRLRNDRRILFRTE